MGRKLLNVGVDARTLGATGIGRYLNELVAEMARQHPETHFHLLVRPDGADLFDRRLASLPNVSTFVTKIAYYSLSERLLYGRQIDQLNLDVVHIPNFNAPRWLKTPFVATIHDLTLLRFPGRRMWPGKRWLYQYVLNSTLRRARRLITLSDWSAQDICSYAEEAGLGPVRSKLRTIPLGVSEVFQSSMTDRDRQAALNDLGLSGPYLLCVGAQLAHKNITRVVEALATLADDAALASLKLVIAGRRTRPAPYLDRVLAAHPELKGRIIFTGTVNDGSLRALYAGATALVFTSLTEGFGLPILEAQAVGCLVITSNQSAMPEVAGKGALLVDPTDTEAIAEAIQKISQGGALVNKLRHNGYDNIKRYNWVKTAAETYSVYQDACQK